MAAGAGCDRIAVGNGHDRRESQCAVKWREPNIKRDV